MKTFCVCFSESKDKLSQWRGYAQDGKGIAIGFDKEVLEELNQISEFDTAFGKVIYDNPLQRSQESRHIFKYNFHERQNYSCLSM